MAVVMSVLDFSLGSEYPPSQKKESIPMASKTGRRLHITFIRMYTKRSRGAKMIVVRIATEMIKAADSGGGFNEHVPEDGVH